MRRSADGSRAPRRVRDRDVVLLATAVVALVLGLYLLSSAVPAVGDFLRSAPVLIVGLIAVTAVVLLRALRPRA